MARNLISDDEWAFLERFIQAVRHPNGRKPSDHRLVLDGIFWIARTGAAWRDLPEEFGKWSSAYRQFRRWTASTDPGRVGRDLAARRKAKGISQRAIAIRLDVSQQTVLALETRFAGRSRTLAGYLRILGLHQVLALPGHRLVLPVFRERCRRDHATVLSPEPRLPVPYPGLADIRDAGVGRVGRFQMLDWRGHAPCEAGNRIECVRVGLAKPVRDPARLTRLLCDKIETIDPGFGIEIMTLTATLAEPLAARQAASSLIETPDPDLSGLIDTLANRVGARAIYRFAPVASDVPERSVCRVPALGAEGLNSHGSRGYLQSESPPSQF